jgi:hypothetical protein
MEATVPNSLSISRTGKEAKGAGELTGDRGQSGAGEPIEGREELRGEPTGVGHPAVTQNKLPNQATHHFRKQVLYF